MVRRFKQEDLETLKVWLQMRGLPLSILKDLPALGLIYPGVGCGFIRTCEGGVGMLDTFVTHPLQSPELRNEAMEALTVAAINEADGLELTRLIVLTTEPNIKARAVRLGFTPTDYAVLTMKV